MKKTVFVSVLLIMCSSVLAEPFVIRKDSAATIAERERRVKEMQEQEQQEERERKAENQAYLDENRRRREMYAEECREAKRVRDYIKSTNRQYMAELSYLQAQNDVRGYCLGLY